MSIPDDFTLSRHDDARLRRLARRHHLALRKSRWRAGSPDNHGGYMLIDMRRNFVVAGSHFDLTGADAADLLSRLSS